MLHLQSVLKLVSCSVYSVESSGCSATGLQKNSEGSQTSTFGNLCGSVLNCSLHAFRNIPYQRQPAAFTASGARVKSVVLLWCGIRPTFAEQ